ncbi:ribosomal S9/S16 family protein [Neorickettsia helminthoeca str. Oregon]|uniref:Small ribosomal subunit protein uS9 n=1 Tax=Neorickettsia helminthoeca str. Oregon TaxID=1286528 RepID=X5HKW5_9RICK|nr:30S ribosomal protein S9 [Neorickettsia helminthoeca]AHX11724.1 ribosomal S9/S16 family protein [Neorickettsia helminthoeca str. Oregon]
MLNSDNQVKRLPVVDRQGRAYGTGRRKTAVARVWIKAGTGLFRVNGKPDLYSHLEHQYLCQDVCSPLRVCDVAGKFDVFATIKGGGVSGQAGALRLGLSRALQNFNPGFREPLKKNSLLVRDSRIVERKKYGKKKARKSFQFSKR